MLCLNMFAGEIQSLHFGKYLFFMIETSRNLFFIILINMDWDNYTKLGKLRNTDMLDYLISHFEKHTLGHIGWK